MNSVSLTGRLTRDPEVRYSAGSQLAVATFTIAVDRPFAKEGEQDADFLRIVCFGKTAENVEKYVFKGYMVGVTGRIQARSYDKDGQKVYVTEIAADRVEFLDRGGKANSEGYQRPVENNPFDDQVPAGFAKLTDDDIPF